MKNNNIQAVIFDIDGVLLDSFDANLKFFQDMMVVFGYKPPSKESYQEIFHFTMMEAIKFLTKSTNKKEINKIWKAGKDRTVPYPTDLLTAPVGVEETLEELSNKYSLGIVTSRIREGIYVIPQMARLEKYFKTTVSFDDTTKHKPHPEPLLLAAEKLGVKPETCVYIGDVENDVLAAKAAGMKSISYSKNKIDKADYSTSLFRELVGLVEKCS